MQTQRKASEDLGSIEAIHSSAYDPLIASVVEVANTETVSNETVLAHSDCIAAFIFVLLSLFYTTELHDAHYEEVSCRP